MYTLFAPALTGIVVMGALWLRDYFGSKGNV